jgi:hypothetical protein
MFSKHTALVLIGLSLLAAACNAPSAEPPSPAPKAAVVAPAAKAVEPVPAAKQEIVTAAVAVAPTPAPLAKASAMAVAKGAAQSADGLVVKRFVVASGIENREPLAVESVSLGALPVFAFAELQNAGDEDKVTITFEREGSSDSVGHVELDVPGATKRWRTWGRTNLIDKAGRWNAVLRDQSGKELSRTAFDVTS